ncbi:MAG: hypothetical protein IH948_01935 [Bacteroidetes bacterium]|nr:hypothetical protein [Bacteroidota bacterium]
MKNFSIIIYILIASICSSVSIVQGQEEEKKEKKEEKEPKDPKDDKDKKDDKIKKEHPWIVNAAVKDGLGSVILVNGLLDQNVGIGLIDPQVKLHIFQEYNEVANSANMLRLDCIDNFTGLSSLYDFKIRKIRKGSPVTALDISHNGGSTLFSIQEDGNIGIGTVPGEKLSVDGIIESETGGFMFPDGTIQTSAFSSLSPVFTDLQVTNLLKVGTNTLTLSSFQTDTATENAIYTNFGSLVLQDRVNSTFNVGIGTPISGPSSPNAVGAAKLIVAKNQGVTQDYFVIQDNRPFKNPAVRFNVESSGKTNMFGPAQVHGLLTCKALKAGKATVNGLATVNRLDVKIEATVSVLDVKNKVTVGGPLGLGIGADNPKEIFQIGDELVIHNGGSKIFGRNFYFENNEDKKFKQGPSMGLCLHKSGILALLTSEDGPPGPFTWDFNLEVLPVNHKNTDLPFGEIKFNSPIALYKDGSRNFRVGIDGNLWARSVKVRTGNVIPDYVFEDDYKLNSLEYVRDFIKENKHLPEIPSQKNIEENDNIIDLGEMQNLLLLKVEEIILYLIQLKKENEELRKEIQLVKENK